MGKEDYVLPLLESETRGFYGAQQKQVRELVEPHLDGVLHRPEDAWTAARLDMSEE